MPNPAARFTLKGSKLYDMVRRTILYFPEIKKIKITEKQIDSISLNKKTASYSFALEIARLIILNYSPDIKSGNNKMLSILFNMNRLWEEYVLISLQKHAEEYRPELKIYGARSKIYTEKLDNPFKLCKKFELTTLNNKKIARIRNTERKPIKKAQRITGKIPYYGATGKSGTIDKFIFDEKLVLVGEDGAKWAKHEPTAYIIL